MSLCVYVLKDYRLVFDNAELFASNMNVASNRTLLLEVV